MRVVTINTNGIRASVKKGLFSWLQSIEPDVVCIQETKAQVAQLQSYEYQLPGYQSYYHDAEKKGYSGVAIFTRHQPQHVSTGFGFDVADNEGRYIQADFKDISIVSVYFPSGTSGEERQTIKYQFLDRFERHLEQLKAQNHQLIICGDVNIVHKERDIKNWKANQKHSGCLPEERAWLDKLFGPMGFVDGFRQVNQADNEYTWWSNRGSAYANNVGWRIDYQVVSPELSANISKAYVYKAERFSDHAPLVIDYTLDLA